MPRSLTLFVLVAAFLPAVATAPEREAERCATRNDFAFLKNGVWTTGQPQRHGGATIELATPADASYARHGGQV